MHINLTSAYMFGDNFVNIFPYESAIINVAAVIIIIIIIILTTIIIIRTIIVSSAVRRGGGGGEGGGGEEKQEVEEEKEGRRWRQRVRSSRNGDTPSKYIVAAAAVNHDIV